MGFRIPVEASKLGRKQLPMPPFWMIAAFLIASVLTFVPLVIAARARFNTSTEPRIHLVQDMGTQPKYREQQSSPVFADGRAARPVIPGTVARGQLQEDDGYHRGYTSITTGADGKPSPQFVNDFPAQVKLDDALLQRGQERFNIYCSACHGNDGSGNGAVNARALELVNAATPGMSWTQPSNLHDAAPRSRALGHLYNTINMGIRNMPGYGSQISVEDRWAIVAYVRALQIQQGVPAAQVPANVKSELK
jgi:mono/diheme cytochrome c family protein